MSTATNLRPSFSRRRRFGARDVRTFKRNVGLQRIQKSQVRSIVKRTMARSAEVKMFSLYYDTAATQTGVFTDMTFIPQGDSYTQRIGHQISLKNVFIKGNVKTGAAGATQLVRVVIFRYLQDSAAGPTQATIFENVTVVQNITSPPKHDSRTFVMLYDKVHSLNADNGSFTKSISVNIRRNIAKKVGYSFGVNSGTNHIYMGILTDAGANFPLPKLTYGCQYTDD